MRGIQLIVGFALVLSIATGCAHPESKVEQVEERPLLVVEGAPESARLLVDGIDAGPAASYSGEDSALRVLPGTHLVEVVDGRRILYQKEIFVGSASTKVIRVVGAQP